MSKKKGGGGEACKWNQGAIPMFEKKSLIVWKFMENVTTSHLIYDLSKQFLILFTAAVTIFNCYLQPFQNSWGSV